MTDKISKIINWSLLKVRMDHAFRNVYVIKKEIWWASIGMNIGHEENGKNSLFERPVLVLRRYSNHLALVVPLSSKFKTNRYYFKIEYKGRISSVLVSQIRVISTKRFIRKIGTLDRALFETIQKEVSVH
ncbi:hypothetical protein CVU83_03185 [Candidatus Falkowbacteria bacterium HGW-Falkowbacteria-2]|uniref:Toxin-antitoxin system protein n=1 Tax=Candidatus Falkowbacteria bacterium HGW-Falkowbacteria-2 TaxID=2013769 RepID=A0A2N2DXT9_9BACT|nr:MAG: hypothetical protein CVU83_03185 [Candidatus Falkowbacteria bacterium HGW-Falkowbacteria-2]